MPRLSKQAALEKQIQAICERMAQEMAVAVRAQVAQEVAQHLMGGSAGSLATRAAGRRRGGGVGADAVEQTLKLIKEHPGLRTEKMYEQLSMPRPTIKAALAKLRDQQKVKVKGERRAATYWPA